MARFSVVVFPRRHHQRATPPETPRVIDITEAPEGRLVPEPAEPVAATRATDAESATSDHTRAAN